MTINTDLMYDVLLEAEAFPEIHNQAAWAQSRACGTAYCMAGLAVALTEDYQFQLKTVDEARDSWEGLYADPEDLKEFLVSRETVLSEFNMVLPNGCTEWDSDDRMSISAAAQQALGLEKAEARAMFDGGNTIAVLWTLAEMYTEGAVTRPAQHVIDEYRLHGSRIKKIDARFFKENAS